LSLVTCRSLTRSTVLIAGAGGRRKRMSSQDGQRHGSNRRSVWGARTLDGGEQDLRGGDRKTCRQCLAGHWLSVVHWSIQPGVPHPDDDELENSTPTQEHSVFKRQYL